MKLALMYITMSGLLVMLGFTLWELYPGPVETYTLRPLPWWTLLGLAVTTVGTGICCAEAKHESETITKGGTKDSAAGKVLRRTFTVLPDPDLVGPAHRPDSDRHRLITSEGKKYRQFWSESVQKYLNCGESCKWGIHLIKDTQPEPPTAQSYDRMGRAGGHL